MRHQSGPFLAGLVLLLVVSWGSTALGQPAELYLDPDTSDVGIGDALEVTIRLNTNGQPVSIVGVFLEFDQAHLAFSSGSTNRTVFDNSLFTGDPQEASPGVVSFSAASGQPLNGNSIEVATVFFDSEAVGEACLTYLTESPQATEVTDADLNALPLDVDGGCYDIIPLTGTVEIDPNPNELAAPWTLNGPGGQRTGDGDTTLTDMPVGTYSLSWGSVTGWIKPENPSDNELNPDATITFSGTYTELPPDTGTVVIDPDPDGLNAPWTLVLPDSTEMSDTGDRTLTDMPVGQYLLSWGDVSGWVAPTDPAPKMLNADQQITFSGIYVEESPTVALISLDAFCGIHATGVSINRAAFPDGNAPYFYPWNIARDLCLTADQKGVFAVDGLGGVQLYSLGNSSLPQIPIEQQSYFVTQVEDEVYQEDVAVAIQATGSSHDAAYVLTDDGRLYPVGNAPLIPEINSLLPCRDGSDEDPDGNPADRQITFPGPLEGPNRIGTISQTGGWNPWSAIDFDLTGVDGALVLTRSGAVSKVGSAENVSISFPYFGPDIARKIEYVNADGVDYAVVLDGLGGVHLCGPETGAVRENWKANVLPNLAYFAGTDGNGDLVGLDAANDFCLVNTDTDDWGVLMIDGLGGVHKANAPTEYDNLQLPYFGGHPEANLHWIVSLIALK